MISCAARAVGSKMCIKFLAQHKRSDSAHFEDNKRAITLEESNLQSILLDASDGNAIYQDNHVEALLTLCWHQYHTRPRTELIEHTLKLAKSLDKKTAIAEALNCYGRILFRLDRYDDASEYLTIARDAFLASNDKSNGALCSLGLVLIYIYSDLGEKLDRSLEEARVLVEDVQSSYLNAKYLLHRGHALYCQRQRPAAMEVLNQAKEMLDERNLSDVGQSLFLLGRCYFALEMYDEAQSSLDHAHRIYETYGKDRYVAEAQHALALVSVATHDYEAAFNAAVRTLEKYRSVGSPLGIGQILQLLGEIWLYRGEYDDARKAFQESLKNYEAIAAAHTGSEQCRDTLLKIEEVTGSVEIQSESDAVGFVNSEARLSSLLSGY